MRILKRLVISLLVAATAFLAAFIITLNFYTTWKAFAHEATARSSALSAGFLTAGSSAPWHSASPGIVL